MYSLVSNARLQSLHQLFFWSRLSLDSHDMRSSQQLSPTAALWLSWGMCGGEGEGEGRGRGGGREGDGGKLKLLHHCDKRITQPLEYMYMYLSEGGMSMSLT